MPAIYPVASTRVSDSMIQSRLISQFQFDQQELVRLQDQVGTGYRISTPSQDAPAAIRAIAMQRLLEQKQQARINLNTTDSFNSATDTALMGATELLTNIRALALSAVNSASTPEQRAVLRGEVNDAVEQFLDIGNREFRGRFLFAGSKSTSQPFSQHDQFVTFNGNEAELRNYIDVDYLSEINVNGAEAFGAISPEVTARNDLNPTLNPSVRLSDLHGGQGISRGGLLVSDGSDSKIIDLSNAETIGDVIALIEANPPDGREINVTLSAHGLVVDLDDAGGGNLTIREVEGGTTAVDLGILNASGTGTSPLQGLDLNPRIQPTTRLADLLGTRASARLTSAGPNNDIFIEAVSNGPEFNNVQIQFVDGAATGNQAIATFNAGTNTLTIDISPGVTHANTVVEAINTTGLFRAELDDKIDSHNHGSAVVDLTSAVTLSGGSGENLDLDSGIQIVNGGVTHELLFTDAETVEDLLNLLNGSDAGVIATINVAGTGIDIRSRLSGADFMIGENGGQTATQLGLRSLTESTYLSELNYGRGIDVADGVDLYIQRRDGVQLDIDLSSAETIQDVLDAINNHSANVGNVVVAQLSESGNGIELVDANAAGTSQLTVLRGASFAAWDIGLVARNEEQAVAAAVGVGQPQSLIGRDVNPLEADGVFNSLLRLSAAIENNDLPQIERAIAKLDDNFTDLLFVRADLGARARSLEVLGERIENEDIELRATLSTEIDADLAQSISELAARQANMEASLRLIAQTMQLTIFNFL